MIPWFLLKALPGFAGFLALPASRPVIYGVLALLLGLTLFIRRDAVIPESMHGLGVLFILFLLVVLLHAGKSGVQLDSAELLVNARSLFLAIALLILVRSGTSARTLLLLVAGYLAVAQLLGVYASASVLLNPGTDVTEQRVTGIYGSSFTVGYSAVALVAVSLLVRELSSHRLVRILTLVFIAAGITSTFLAINRTSIGAMVLVLGGWAAQRMYSSARARGGFTFQTIALVIASLVVGAAILVQIALWVAPGLVELYATLWRIRLEAINEGQDVRWLTIVAGWRMFVEHPLIGVGWDQAAQFSERFGATMVSTAHNVFVQGAAEGGILGLAYTVGLFVLVPFRLFQLGKDVPGRWVFAGAWLGVLFFNTVASNLHLESHWDVLMAWMLALAMRDQATDAAPALAADGAHRASPRPALSDAPPPLTAIRRATQ